MCWINNVRPEPIIATKDIHTFKVALVENDEKQTVKPYFKYYTNTEYQEGKEYYTKLGKLMKESYTGKYYIKEGFHSYDTRNIRIKRVTNYAENIFKIVTEKITTDAKDVIAKPQMYNGQNVAIMLCIIPQGTIYYKNSMGEIVSPYLKVKQIIKNPFEMTKARMTTLKSINEINNLLNDWENKQ